jgi:hypothetical protein
VAFTVFVVSIAYDNGPKSINCYYMSDKDKLSLVVLLFLNSYRTGQALVVTLSVTFKIKSTVLACLPTLFVIDPDTVTV